MPLDDLLLALATVLQAAAVLYGCVLLTRRRGAAGAWTALLAAMLSMLVWRVVMLSGVTPPAFFNPMIAIWGSTCMVAAMFLFGREVARRERAEAERDASLASERAARNEAERASRLKDDFLATLSHELRTPLAAITSWCTILDLHRDDASTGRAIETIARNARAQTRLVDDLLDMTRIQAGSLHVDRTTIALDAPVRAAIEAVRPAADAKRIAIELTVDADPPHVEGDAMRLQQVAANLLGNAVKFSAAGGAVEVRVRADGAHAIVSVTDHGDGITPEFLPHVFERFRQGDSQVTRRHGGLGLGLAIAAHLVDVHDGSVRAESDGPGCGATFTVTLPLTRVPAPGTIVDAGPAPTHPAPDLAATRVLVVDDEDDVRTGIAGLLESARATVLTLESGAGVESALAEFRPHVLVLDIGMPGEDGYSVIRRVRGLPPDAGGDVPAISLTAHARSEDRARALASGFQRHLPKPIELAALVRVIRELASADVRASEPAT